MDAPADVTQPSSSAPILTRPDTMSAGSSVVEVNRTDEAVSVTLPRVANVEAPGDRKDLGKN